MAINFTDFSKIPVQKSPLSDVFANLLQGYKMQREPGRMKREQEQQELANAFQQLKMQEEPQRFKADMEGKVLNNDYLRQQMQMAGPLQQAKLALMQAQMQKANRAPQSEIEKMIFGLKSVESQFGVNSPEAAIARQFVQGKSKGGFVPDDATKAFLTQNQTAAQAIDNTLPLIDDLIKNKGPGQLAGWMVHPNDQATYKAKTAETVDSLVKALKLPNTNESLELASTMVNKHAWETDKNYEKRLKSLKKELQERRQRHGAVSQTGKSAQGDAMAGGSTRVFYQGKSHLIPNEQVQAALDAGGSLNG